jgi:hypothetical protein
MSLLETENSVVTNNKTIQSKLDHFENKLQELKILYEQYFCALRPLVPEAEHQEVKILVRTLLKTPFKNSQANFRLKNLVLRFQTLQTYWERILKQREEGRYAGDKFRATIRKEIKDDVTNKRNAQSNKEECLYQELFNSYTKALRTSGLSSTNIDFKSFKSELQKKSEILRQSRNASAVNFRVEIEKGKVSIKAKVE